jgi:hypothetical protein
LLERNLIHNSVKTKADSARYLAYPIHIYHIYSDQTTYTFLPLNESLQCSNWPTEHRRSKAPFAAGPVSCNYHNRLAPVSYAAKRAFDVVAATAGLVLSSPMFLLVSIAIKIDSRDPVFQPQMLHGYIQL